MQRVHVTEKIKTGTADANLFMMCRRLNSAALTELPPGYHFRRIHEGEIESWKRMPFDDERTAAEHLSYMTGFFERVYAPQKSLFLERCLFACDKDDQPVGTGFIWEACGNVPTVHWYKVKKEYEGRGIGRALLSKVMQSAADYPVYLHTQPGSFRAIKLYTDFGFELLLDPVIGSRNNEIEEGLPYLKKCMPEAAYRKLCFGYADREFLRVDAEGAGDDF